MGVPAFFRWVSEKYSRVISDVLEDAVPYLEDQYQYGTSVDLEAPNPNDIEFDNLYIDMNGIIHPCAHPENGPQPETEAEMYLNVMNYVDRLVACVRPRKLLYLAIDGVAPRAKMNQQRSRRFRSAKEADEAAEVDREAREYIAALHQSTTSGKGSKKQLLPPSKPWDSNVITPGTKFMSKLSQYLHYYIHERINHSKGWRKFKVILSDASVPGEGEHKIMTYIRNQRRMEGYDVNQHHILHGLDADLIMLALATHEPRFTILREEVLFGKQKYEYEQMKKKRKAESESSTEMNAGAGGGGGGGPHIKPLQFLHVHILREYLAFEFQEFLTTLDTTNNEKEKTKILGPTPLDRIVDDFIFLCFFVGNDFLPHLPCLDIRDGALDYLILVYKKHLPEFQTKDYLTSAGKVHLANVNVMLSEIGAVESEIFRRKRLEDQRQARFQENRLKTRQQGGRDQIGARFVKDQAQAIVSTSRDGSNAAVAKRMRADLLGLGSGSSKVEESTRTTDPDHPYTHLSPEEAVKARVSEHQEAKLSKYRANVVDVVKLGEEGWKDRYYADKYKQEDIATGGGRAHVFECYIQGLCWVMQYYYCGCPSYSWFYPFHYAPFASDLVDIERLGESVQTFDLGQPFRPFEQLMGVFPPASGHALPECYRRLMTDAESDIVDFYPLEIPMDPNGKAMPWLWVVLLPFIDEHRLLLAMSSVETNLTRDERHRNRRVGEELIFGHVSLFPDINELFSTTILNTNNKTKTSSSSWTLEHSLHGLSGSVSLHPQVSLAIGSTVKGLDHNDSAQRRNTSILNNESLAFQYEYPSQFDVKEHRCYMLEGVKMPEAELGPEHANIRIPRLGKGRMSILDLAQYTPSHHQAQQQLGQQQYRQNHHHHRPQNHTRQPYQQNNDHQQQQRGGYQHPPPPPHHHQYRQPDQQYRRQHHPNSNNPNHHHHHHHSFNRPPAQGRRHEYDDVHHRPPPPHASRHHPRAPQAIQSNVFSQVQDRYSASSSGPQRQTQPPSLDSLRANLMNIHQGRGTYPPPDSSSGHSARHHHHHQSRQQHDRRR